MSRIRTLLTATAVATSLAFGVVSGKAADIVDTAVAAGSLRRLSLQFRQPDW